jgi:hypothetical protein
MQILVECYPQNVRRRRTRNLNLLYQVSPHVRSLTPRQLKQTNDRSQVMSHIISTLSHSRPLGPRTTRVKGYVQYTTTYICQRVLRVQGYNWKHFGQTKNQSRPVDRSSTSTLYLLQYNEVGHASQQLGCSRDREVCDGRRYSYRLMWTTCNYIVPATHSEYM